MEIKVQDSDNNTPSLKIQSTLVSSLFKVKLEVVEVTVILMKVD